MAKSTKNTRRPRAGGPKTERLLIRLDSDEKEAYELAASLARMKVSTWVRDRLRRAVNRELEAEGQPNPLLRGVTVE
jgi:hypothetical protein